MSKSIKSFWKGVGQSIDITGALAPRSAKSSALASKNALASDWKAIGRDIQNALDKTGATKMCSSSTSKKKVR